MAILPMENVQHLANQGCAGAFPSSAAFDVISDALAADESGRKDAIKKGRAVFAFTLKNHAGQVESWYVDLKDSGVVGKGIGPEGKTADGQC